MNLGFDDNRVCFFFEGGELGYFGGRRKKRMTAKRGRLKQNIRKSTIWMKCRFLQKLWNQAPASSHAHPHLSVFEPGGMLSVTFEKRQRRGRTVHLSETPVFSLFGERYPAEHITVSAWIQRVLSVDPRHRARKTDNTAKWCPSVSDLMLNFGMPPVKIYTASDNQPTEKVNQFISVILNYLFRNELCLKHHLSYILPLTDMKKYIPVK